MSMHITVSCEGTRRGQPCRGALHTKALDPGHAQDEAWRSGWTSDADSGDRCPSAGHDTMEER